MGAQSATTLLACWVIFNGLGQLAQDAATSSPIDVALGVFMGLPDGNRELLRVLRPAAVGATERALALSDIPPENVVQPSRVERAKLAALDPVLAYHERRATIAVRVIDVPPAVVGLHRRAVVIVSRRALQLLSTPELQAAVAHEMGHDYFGSLYDAARARHDVTALEILELQCDGVGALTLVALDIRIEHLFKAIDKIGRFNQVPKTRWRLNGYPSPETRRQFVRRFLQSRSPKGVQPGGRPVP